MQVSLYQRFTLKELPVDERPRERLLRYGSSALSNRELLAIILRTGDASGNKTALDLAGELLMMGYARAPLGCRDSSSGLRFLANVSVEEMTEIKGIGVAKAVQVRAALEIGKRLGLEPSFRVQVTSPHEVSSLLMGEMRHLEQESFRSILLDARNQVISIEVNSIGGLQNCSAHPREVFKPAIRKNAAAILLVHNHPSGDPTPSQEDVELTRVLVDAGRLLGIEVLDHVIIGDNRYVSFRQLGLVF